MAKTTDTNKFLHQIRDQYFYIEIFLYNQIEGAKPLALPFLFVDSFSIQESLKNWITEGWIIINDDFEVFERGAPANNKMNLPKIDSPYIFRTDGRNRISFRIYPCSKNNINDDTYPKENWEICYDFVIYDVEDLPTNTNHKKLRKYYFWDERYQLFSERNIEYSTVYSATKKVDGTGKVQFQLNDYSSYPDIKKAVIPNDALKDIIRVACSDPPIVKISNNESSLKVGFKQDGSIDNPTEPVYSLKDPVDPDWNVGTASNKIIYTSPANYSAVDDINYVLDRCSSTDNGPVFLQLGRTSNDKKFKLIGLSDIFKSSTSNQVERLYIDDSVTFNSAGGNKNATGSPNIPRASVKIDDKNSVNFTSPVASRITSYEYSPMVALDDFRILNLPLHTYDFSTGEFKIYFNENTAKDVKKVLESYAKKGLYSFSPEAGGNTKPQLILNLNQTKQKGIYLENNFVSQKFFPANYSQIKMIKDLLFLSEAISFVAQGLTIRTPGKFIFVDRIDNGFDNPFDNRFLGQWLMTKVNHIFTQQKYLTEVVAVKIDAFNKLWQDSETKN